MYIFRSSRLFLEYPDTFFILSGHFLHHLETFQFIPTLFRSSWNFPVHLYTLYIIWIFCIVSGHFPKYPEILQPIMSFLQKLSGFAKTFRSALLTCWRGFSDSAPPTTNTRTRTVETITWCKDFKWPFVYYCLLMFPESWCKNVSILSFAGIFMATIWWNSRWGSDW